MFKVFFPIGGGYLTRSEMREIIIDLRKVITELYSRTKELEEKVKQLEDDNIRRMK